MAAHQVLKTINVNPAWEFPTYRFWVHLDTDKLHESGLPDMTFVQPFEISTAPPGVEVDGLTGEQVLASLEETIDAHKSDLVRNGVLAGKADVDIVSLAKEAAKVNPQRLEFERQQAEAIAAKAVIV